MDKLTRRQIRYICFRLQIEAEGGNKAQPDKLHLRFVDEVKKHMEGQSEFDGWKNFGKTWDVGNKAPLVIVSRTSSIQTEWNKVLEKEAKEFPVEEEKKKLLTNELSEKVQERKEEQDAEHLPGETQQETVEIKQVKNDLQEEVQQNKKQSKKTSFWDKLK